MTSSNGVLSVDVIDDRVYFDLESSMSAAAKNVLFIETLSGEIVRTLTVGTFPVEINLESGAYRAFVQQQEPRSVSSTQKEVFFVE